MSWWEYVERVAKTSRQRDISDKTGIDATNVTRWKTGTIPKPAFVADFARSYGRPVLEAFVAAGFLTEKEAKARPAAAPDYTQLTNDELLKLVRARMRDGGEHGGDTAATKTNVTPLSAPAANVLDVAKAADADERGEQSAVAEQGEPDSP